MEKDNKEQKEQSHASSHHHHHHQKEPKKDSNVVHVCIKFFLPSPELDYFLLISSLATHLFKHLFVSWTFRTMIFCSHIWGPLKYSPLVVKQDSTLVLWNLLPLLFELLIKFYGWRSFIFVERKESFGKVLRRFEKLF